MSDFYQELQDSSNANPAHPIVGKADELPEITVPLDLLAALGLDDQTARDFKAQSERLIGRIIGQKYELLELLGAGGMGFVYKARHIELDKLMAIKVLLLDKPLSDVAYKRFEQEARATGALDHPNIVRVTDSGQIGEGSPYIVMELLKGHSLDDLISAEHPLKIEEALPIFIQLADALAHAHSRGVIHRDLKPSNVMVTQDDRGQRQTKIIDFGIAKLSGSWAKAKPITKPGEIFGSPLYMSPEQCTGNILDQRSDIYSLGCIMYEMLGGKPPFVGDSVLATIYMHVNEPAAKISESAATTAIPEGLEKIIEQCLQKNPDSRFQSADELLAALQRFQQKYAEKGNVKGLSALPFGAFRWSKSTIFVILALTLATALWVFLSLVKDLKTNPRETSDISNSLTHKLSPARKSASHSRLP